MKNLKAYPKLYEKVTNDHEHMLIKHGFQVVKNPSFDVNKYSTVFEKYNRTAVKYRIILEEGSIQLYSFIPNMVLEWSISFSSGVPISILEQTIKAL